jgi:hypothetical protein
MSKIEVDAIDKQSGSTLTIGGSGTTVQLGTGATQTGFGREGSVNWQTGSIKTGTFTAVSGEGYFVDTSSGGVTCNLPAGSAGAIVAFSDYTRTFGTNNLTISPNGSEKIGGIAQAAKLSVSGQSATFVYVDGTEGWINVQETQTSQTGAVDYMSATGGNTVATVCTNFKVHTFTSPGTFCVSQISTVCASRNEVSYMVIAGGGAGGGGTGAGGGAGGFREGKNSSICTYSVSPLNAPAGIAVTASAFPITVGAGGASSPGGSPFGNKGSNSIFSTITSAGGGGGAAYTYDSPNAPSSNPGGSGGGGTYDFPGGGVSSTPYPSYRGDGNSPPVSPPQGQPGGGGNNSWTTSVSGGGGGGATDAGSIAATQQGGNGGDGATTSINGTPTTRAGGGGGGGQQPGTSGGNPGPGGGGAGGTPPYPSTGTGQAGTVNTGGGGGGSMDYGPGSGAGGSGIVIIRYRFQ